LRRTGWRAAATPAETLKGDELTAWAASVAVLAEMSGLDAEQAETALTRAYGWGSQLYWRQEIQNQVPDPAKIMESMQYLREVMGEQADVQKVVTGFPECVAFAVDGPAPSLQYAVGFVATEWGLEGKAAQQAFKRKPKALGCRIDCLGDCIGQCHWCWAKYSNRPRYS
jgi:hypothetical protein